jgi:anthranilate phosphoribosyltransferase
LNLIRTEVPLATMAEQDTDRSLLMRSILQRIATGPELSKDISLAEARDAMSLVLNNEVDPVQSAIFLIALRMKRETDDENLGVLEAIRTASHHQVASVDEVLEIADPFDGFNRNLLVSPFLPALMSACGVPTVSHGGESVGPKFGATHHKVLAACGIKVTASPDAVAGTVSDPRIGWGYADQSQFTPKLHQLARLRDLIVKRPVITTVEVLAGSIRGRKRTSLMTGYVHKPYPRICALLARAAGYDDAMIVRGVEGGVLPSMRQTAKVWAYQNKGAEVEYDLDPAQFGIEQTVRGVPLPQGLPGYRKKTDDIGVKIDPDAMAQAAASLGMETLDGADGPARDALIYGAALALRHLGRAATYATAADMARSVLDSGAALTRFNAAVAAT